ncbi:hypothetical protein EON78_07140 [bacterium]|nr:MAG: hypothetical protein EON78_07140 [bacterium]
MFGFYKYYNEVESDNAIVSTLKHDISSHYNNWSDLELALGKYTQNLKTSDEFDELIQDILNNLGDYLEGIENQIDFSLFNKEKLYKYLCNPEASLPKGDSNTIEAYKSAWVRPNWSINVVTFNYTQTFEKIINYTATNQIIGKHHQGNIVLKNIYHLHGFSDDRMIIGVNDVTQIDNKDFHSNPDILEALVKSEYNRAMRHTVDEDVISQILSANLICIFGSAIGDTDNCWWELIGEQLKRDCRIIIFTKGEEFNKRFGFMKTRIERKMKEYFLNKTQLTVNEKENFANNIYIGVNSDMFSDIKF